MLITITEIPLRLLRLKISVLLEDFSLKRELPTCLHFPHKKNQVGNGKELAKQAAHILMKISRFYRTQRLSLLQDNATNLAYLAHIPFHSHTWGEFFKCVRRLRGSRPPMPFLLVTMTS